MLRKAELKDSNALAKLALLLWPNHTFEKLHADIEPLLTNPNAAFFLYYVGELPVGFAQYQLRHDYVEGTESSPVGYLEGVFVLECHRKRGIAAQLLTQCERWAAEQGCAEFASDCELDNAESYAFHLKCGFREANRVICFSKKLAPSND